MLRRVLRNTGMVLGATAFGGSTYVLHQSGWDVSSIGAVRFGRAAVAAAACVVDYKWSLRGLEEHSAEYRTLKSHVHTRCAERLRSMCCVNGGCFIKVGQHVGTLDYLLPAEYVQAMKGLHDKAPESPLPDLLTVVKEDFGVDASELFTEFDEHPLGAASLAQVHRAKLKDGTEVAVKIQHPKVKAHAVVDMATMEFLVNRASDIFPEFDFCWLARETRHNLPLELDFIQEGKNCERAGRMLQKFPFVKVPRVYWDLSSSRVLTMEYCRGGRVDDKHFMTKHGIDVAQISAAMGKMYSEMIFVNGFVHCDPHPGNVLVEPRGDGGMQLVLLDHGLYTELTDEFRQNYCRLWRSLINADVEGIREGAAAMNCGQLYNLFSCIITGRSWNSITDGIDKVKFTSAEASEIRESAAQYLPQISEILRSVPRELLLILKTNDVIRGIEHALGARSSSSSFIEMSRCCVRAIGSYERRMQPSALGWMRSFAWEKMQLCGIALYAFSLWLRSVLLDRVKKRSEARVL